MKTETIETMREELCQTRSIGLSLMAALNRLLDSPCCNEGDQDDETCEAIEQAIAAIAKAEGK